MSEAPNVPGITLKIDILKLGTNKKRLLSSRFSRLPGTPTREFPQTKSPNALANHLKTTTCPQKLPESTHR
jgi:hypothetical protein